MSTKVRTLSEGENLNEQDSGNFLVTDSVKLILGRGPGIGHVTKKMTHDCSKKFLEWGPTSRG